MTLGWLNNWTVGRSETEPKCYGISLIVFELLLGSI